MCVLYNKYDFFADIHKLHTYIYIHTNKQNDMDRKVGQADNWIWTKSKSTTVTRADQ